MEAVLIRVVRLPLLVPRHVRRGSDIQSTLALQGLRLQVRDIPIYYDSIRRLNLKCLKRWAFVFDAATAAIRGKRIALRADYTWRVRRSSACVRLRAKVGT
jgi:hypothetical protein